VAAGGGRFLRSDSGSRQACLLASQVYRSRGREGVRKKRIKARFSAALSDPSVLGLIATLACPLRSVATPAIDLRATPDCWSRFEKTRDELEDVNCGCYADKSGKHVNHLDSVHHGPAMSASASWLRLFSKLLLLFRD
jgi:hypothetical protein